MSFFDAGMGVGITSGYAAYQGTQQTNRTNRAIADDQMAHSASQAAINRDWQNDQRIAVQDYNTQMSNTAVSRRVADMRRAGINPILAAKHDASSPTSSAGSGGQGGLPGLPNIATPMINAVAGLNSGMEILERAARIQQTRSQTKITGAAGDIAQEVLPLITEGIEVIKQMSETSAKNGERLGRKLEEIVDKITDIGGDNITMIMNVLEDVGNDLGTGASNYVHKFKQMFNKHNYIK
jgi:hypothetical protein